MALLPTYSHLCRELAPVSPAAAGLAARATVLGKRRQGGEIPVGLPGDNEAARS